MNTGNETKPSNDLLPFEKLKFYTDLYKFYSELPFKIVATYAVASGLTLNVTANFTKNLLVIGPLCAFVIVIGFFIGRQIYRVDSRYLEPHRNEIDSLKKELALNIVPNFHIMRFILRLTVVLLFLVPTGAAFLLLSFLVR